MRNADFGMRNNDYDFSINCDMLNYLFLFAVLIEATVIAVS
jgi:hypothetical protein